MDARRWFYLFLCLLVAADGDAKCAGFPLTSHIEGDVELRSCVAGDPNDRV